LGKCLNSIFKPSSFEGEVLHHAKKMWSKSIRKDKLIIVTIGHYIL